MTPPDPLHHKTFVQADGKLAEFMCHVHVTDLTPVRARELRHIHRHHLPDDCMVHLAAAVMLLDADDR